MVDENSIVEFCPVAWKQRRWELNAGDTLHLVLNFIQIPERDGLKDRNGSKVKTDCKRNAVEF